MRQQMKTLNTVLPDPIQPGSLMCSDVLWIAAGLSIKRMLPKLLPSHSHYQSITVGTTPNNIKSLALLFVNSAATSKRIQDLLMWLLQPLKISTKL